jgi:hypothetical protein
MFWNENIHTWKSDDGNVSVTTWIGDNYFSRTAARMNSPPPNSWAADPENDVAIFHITLRAGGTLTLPKAKKGPWPRDDMVFPKEKGRFALIDGVESFPPSVVDKKEDEL